MEFIKRSTTSIISSQIKMSVSQYQKETRTDTDKLEKEKNLHNLPKVGVCSVIITYFFNEFIYFYIFIYFLMNLYEIN